MSEKLHGQERSNIDINDEDALQRWMKELGVTKEKLFEAVNRVGNSPSAVRDYLQHGASQRQESSP